MRRFRLGKTPIAISALLGRAPHIAVLQIIRIGVELPRLAFLQMRVKLVNILRHRRRQIRRLLQGFQFICRLALLAVLRLAQRQLQAHRRVIRMFRQNFVK